MELRVYIDTWFNGDHSPSPWSCDVVYYDSNTMGFNKFSSTRRCNTKQEATDIAMETIKKNGFVLQPQKGQ